jgi:hypothetical protein
MKHGDKKKASKASGKKTSTSGGKGGSKVVQSLKGKQASSSAKASPKKADAPAKTPPGGNGKPKGRPAEGGIHFTNPAVGAAFKRAVKKFPNAFKRLTD